MSTAASGQDEKRYNVEYASSGDSPQLKQSSPSTVEGSGIAGQSVGETRSDDAPITALFVAHGMGQQITFQTLDQISEGLLRVDPVDHRRTHKPVVRVIKSGDDVLTRIELELHDEAGGTHQVHVYEGYWAPLTEGQVKLGDVIGFLVAAGTNGIQNGCTEFKRWMFNSYCGSPPPIRAVMYLLFALGTVAALIAMNATIGLVMAAKAPFVSPPAWLTKGLLEDLTLTFKFLLALFAIFGLLLWVSTLIKGKKSHASKKGAKQPHGSKRPRRTARKWLQDSLGLLVYGLFFATLGTTMLAGVALPLIYCFHTGPESVGKGRLFWAQMIDPMWLDRCDVGVSCFLLLVIVAVAARKVLPGAYQLVRAIFRNTDDPPRTFAIAIYLAVVVGLAGWMVVYFGGQLAPTISNSLSLPTDSRQFFTLNSLGKVVSAIVTAISWPLLVGVSLFVRQILVQYLGDVAAYVTPHKLDRFNDLRTKIKACVAKSARAVYSLRQANGEYQYDRVLIVGHSLGSVIVYDTLNGLINDDLLTGERLKVVKRTPLLLTFGSPLNKTAFLFALQKHQTDEAREALAAAIQPLILDYKFRPRRWVNIWSSFDIISGALTYYDKDCDKKSKAGNYDNPDPDSSKRVENLQDLDATTMLYAHLEYWDNSLLFVTLHNEVTCPTKA